MDFFNNDDIQKGRSKISKRQTTRKSRHKHDYVYKVFERDGFSTQRYEVCHCCVDCGKTRSISIQECDMASNKFFKLPKGYCSIEFMFGLTENLELAYKICDWLNEKRTKKSADNEWVCRKDL